MFDHTLIELARTFERQFARVEKSLRAIGTDFSPATRDEAADKIIAPLNRTMAAIADSQATTIEGLVIKARAATLIDSSVDDAIAESIVRDLRALPAAHCAVPVEAGREVKASRVPATALS